MSNLDDRARYEAMNALDKAQKLDEKTWWMQPFGLVPIGIGFLLLGVAAVARSTVKRKPNESDSQEE